MKSNIQIKFLTLDQMCDAKNIDWRYEHVGIDNLGFADKAKNRVYVRAGLEPELTKYLIDHELEHLFEMEGTDEDEHGIRHKKKGNVFRAIAEFIGKIIPNEISKVNSVTSNIPVLGQISQAASAADAAATAYGDTGKLMPSIIAGSQGYAGQSQDPGQYGSTTRNNDIWNQIGGAGNTFNSIQSLFGGSGAAGGSQNGYLSPNAGISFGQGAAGGETNIGSMVNPSSYSNSSNGLSGLLSLFSGVLGSGQSSQGGYKPTSSSQSFRFPDFSQQANNNPNYSGWGVYGDLPVTGSNYGQSGMESITNSRSMGGQSMMPKDIGTAQAGISAAGKDPMKGFGQQSIGGMDQMFNVSDPFGASNMMF